MSPLEQAIQEAASDGRLSGLSIRQDPSGRGWQANAPSEHGAAWAVAIDQNPVAALLAALRHIEPSAPELSVSVGRGVFD